MSISDGVATLVAAFLAIFVPMGLTWRARQSRRTEAISEAVQLLIFARLEADLDAVQNSGSVDIRRVDSFLKIYKQLGGNGSAAIIHEEIVRLQIDRK